MRKYKILNFQNLKITEAQVSDKPFDKTSFDDKNIMTVVIIRDPFDYFDTLLMYYINTIMSPNLKKDVLTQMRILSNEAFLEWFSTLNYLPLINPQTFQLDMKKRIDTAIENLESFDYVIPYKVLETFIENVTPDINIQKQKKEPLPFLLSSLKEVSLVEKFIGKDIVLYKKAIALWQVCQTSNFKPVHSLTGKDKLALKVDVTKYIGIVDQIKPKQVSGWVFHKENAKSLKVGLFKNDILIKTVKANIMRLGVKKNKNHPTGLCGFEFILNNERLKKTDKIDVKILSDKTIIEMSEKSKTFFNRQF